jgi:hypothetical protein
MYRGQAMKIEELYPPEGEAPIIYEATFIAWTGKGASRKAIVQGAGGDFVVPMSHIIAPLGAHLDPNS